MKKYFTVKNGALICGDPENDRLVHVSSGTLEIRPISFYDEEDNEIGHVWGIVIETEGERLFAGKLNREVKLGQQVSIKPRGSVMLDGMKVGGVRFNTRNATIVFD